MARCVRAASTATAVGGLDPAPRPIPLLLLPVLPVPPVVVGAAPWVAPLGRPPGVATAVVRAMVRGMVCAIVWGMACAAPTAGVNAGEPKGRVVARVVAEVEARVAARGEDRGKIARAGAVEARAASSESWAACPRPPIRKYTTKQ